MKMDDRRAAFVPPAFAKKIAEIEPRAPGAWAGNRHGCWIQI
jgi:hypothetical protein